MGSRSKTITSLSITPLLFDYYSVPPPKLKLNDALFLQDMKGIRAGFDKVLNSRKMTINQISALYNPRFLKAIGYDIDSTIQVKGFNSEALLAIARAKYGNEVSSVTSLGIGVPTDRTIVYNNLYEEHNFSYDSNSVQHPFTHPETLLTSDKAFKISSYIEMGEFYEVSIYLDKDTTTAEIIEPFIDSKYATTSGIEGLTPEDVELNSETLITTYPEGFTYSHEIIYISDRPTLEYKWLVRTRIIRYEVVETQETQTVQVGEDLEGNPIFEDVIVIVKTLVQTESEVEDLIDAILSSIEVTNPFWNIAQTITSMFNGTKYIYYTYVNPNSEDGTDIVRFTIDIVVTWVDGITYTVKGTFIRSDYGKYNNNSPVAEIDAEDKVMVGIKKYLEDSFFRFISYEYVLEGKRHLTYTSEVGISSLYSTQSLDVFPFIPLKESKKLVNEKKMNVALSKIGFTGNDFKKSLENPDIHSAFLSFLLPIHDLESEAIRKMIFFSLADIIEQTDTSKVFVSGWTDATSDSRGRALFDFLDASISFAGLQMDIGLNAKVEREITTNSENVIGNVDKVYVTREIFIPRECTEDIGCIDEHYITVEDVNIIKLIYRESKTSNIVLTVNDLFIDYVIDGANFNLTLSKNGMTGLYLPIVQKYFKKMSMSDKVEIVEKSASILAFFKKTVKLKWYQTGVFGVILKVIAAVIMYYSGFTIGQMFLAFFFSTIVMNMSLPPFLKGVLMIAMMIYGMYTAPAGAADVSPLIQTLNNASMAVNVVSTVSEVYFSLSTQRLKQDYDRLQAETKLEKEELEEKQEKLQKGVFMDANLETPDIDNYYRLALGEESNNYDSYFNIDALYDVY